MANSDYIFGIRAVLEAIDSGKTIEKVFVKKGLESDLSKELFSTLAKHNILYQLVPVEKLTRITRGNHQGVIALSSAVTYHQLEDVVMNCFESGVTPLFLVLDGITDVRNFGAIARTAECAGVHCIVFPEKGSATPNSDSVKTSAGALLKIPICKVRDLHKAVRFLKDSGLMVFAATEKSAKEFTKVDLTMPLALIMGAEDVGVSDKLLELSNEKIAIPMFGSIQSLNVSVATGVLLYESIRQKSLL